MAAKVFLVLLPDSRDTCWGVGEVFVFPVSSLSVFVFLSGEIDWTLEGVTAAFSEVPFMILLPLAISLPVGFVFGIQLLWVFMRPCGNFGLDDGRDLLNCLRLFDGGVLRLRVEDTRFLEPEVEPSGRTFFDLICGTRDNDATACCILRFSLRAAFLRCAKRDEMDEEVEPLCPGILVNAGIGGGYLKPPDSSY